MSTLLLPVSASDHSAGPENAPIVLVEYGDLECPDCAEAYPLIKERQKELGDALCFVFRHMPLDQVYPIHPHATQAALAAEAASNQGKFWEMHDLLFENQDRFGSEDFLRYAESLGLDMQAFSVDMASPEIIQRIADSVENGKREGVTSTPIFFLNGERVENSRDYASLAARLHELAS